MGAFSLKALVGFVTTTDTVGLVRSWQRLIAQAQRYQLTTLLGLYPPAKIAQAQQDYLGGANGDNNYSLEGGSYTDSGTGALENNSDSSR